MKRKHFLKEAFKNLPIVLDIIFNIKDQRISPKNKLVRSYIDYQTKK